MVPESTTHHPPAGLRQARVEMNQGTFVCECWQDGQLVSMLTMANPIVDNGINEVIDVDFNTVTPPTIIWPEPPLGDGLKVFLIQVSDSGHPRFDGTYEVTAYNEMDARVIAYCLHHKPNTNSFEESHIEMVKHWTKVLPS
ncbi:MAG: hypothetical protein ACYS7Y_12005 [Planctomycetota bacterium]|jgi:hypothetical protein